MSTPPPPLMVRAPPLTVIGVVGLRRVGLAAALKPKLSQSSTPLLIVRAEVPAMAPSSRSWRTPPRMVVEPV